MAENESTIRIRAKDETAAGLRSVKQNLQNLTSAVGVVQGPLNGLTGRMSYFNTIVGRTGVNIAVTGAALAGLTKVMYESFQAGIEAESQLYKIEAVLKATGYAAGLSSQSLEDMAAKLDASTLASVNGIREAQAVLLTYRTIVGDTFERALTSAQDMVAVFGGDLRSSANQLGKALENPTIGLSALTEKGITFTESEKKMVKAMQEAGDIAGAQEIVFKKLESQIGGAGAGAAKGTAGAIDTLTSSWTSLLETLSKSVYGKAVDEFFLGIAGGLKSIKRAIEGPSINEQIETIIVKIGELERKKAESLSGNSEWKFADAAQIDKEILYLKFSHQALVDRNAELNNYNYALEQVAIATQLNSQAEIKQIAAAKKATEDYNSELDNRILRNKEIEQDTLKQIQMDRDRRDYSTALIGSEKEQSELKYIRKKEEIESLFGLNLESQRLSEAAYQEHLDRMTSADEDRAQKERDIKLNNAQNIASVIGNLGQLALGQSKKNFSTYKNLMRAETYISTIASAQAAYHSTLKYGGTVLGASFAAASALSAGLLRLQQINSTSLSGGTSGGASSSGGAPATNIPPINYGQGGKQQQTTVNIYIPGRSDPISLIVDGVVKAIQDDKLILSTQNGRERIVAA